MDQPRYQYEHITVPMLDTGIGKKLGFENDQALREHVAAERAKLPEDVQAALRDYDREYTRRLLWG